MSNQTADRPVKQAMSGRALIKIKETKHPISEVTIGFRIQAAHPNKAGRDYRGNPIPAFRKPFLIAESSDYTTITEKEFDTFTGHLRSFHGYTEFPIVSAPK